MVKNGFILPLMVFAPNLFVLFFPPKDSPPRPEETGILKLMTGLERLGQVSVLLIPFFYSINIDTSFRRVGFSVLLISISLYYVGWLRYLLAGRHYKHLFYPMLGIPIPMAIAPIIYFFAAALVLGSWPLVIGTISLAVGHLYISYNTFVQIEG